MPRKTPLDRLVDGVGDRIEDLADALLEGLLVAGIGVLAGTVAGKAAPVVAEQLRKAIRTPEPRSAKKPPGKVKRARKQLGPGKPAKTARRRRPAPAWRSRRAPAQLDQPGPAEVIDLHPDAQGVYR